MTREEAREALWSNGHGDSNWIITKIYNDHEAQLKAKNKEIEELKADLQGYVDQQAGENL